jgi:hypothetical protein
MKTRDAVTLVAAGVARLIDLRDKNVAIRKHATIRRRLIT